MNAMSEAPTAAAAIGEADCAVVSSPSDSIGLTADFGRDPTRQHSDEAGRAKQDRRTVHGVVTLTLWGRSVRFVPAIKQQWRQNSTERGHGAGGGGCRERSGSRGAGRRDCGRRKRRRRNAAGLPPIENAAGTVPAFKKGHDCSRPGCSSPCANGAPRRA